MTAEERLAAVRRGLDTAAQQATAATPFRWRQGRKVKRTLYQQIVTEPNDNDNLIGVLDFADDAAHIAAWSPSHVTAVVGSLRTICDGIEKRLGRHVERRQGGMYGLCLYCGRKNGCPDYDDALADLAGLAAVWAPTEQETP